MTSKDTKQIERLDKVFFIKISLLLLEKYCLFYIANLFPNLSSIASHTLEDL